MGKIFAVVAVWTHSIVATIVIFEATHSARMVGLVGVVQFAPQVILSPTSGKSADRGNMARQIVIGSALCAAGSGSIATWLALTPDSEGSSAAVAVLIGSTLVGFGFAVSGPAMQSIVPSLVRDGELPVAMALNSLPTVSGRIAGPIVGAYLAAHLGAAATFAVSARLHLIFVISIVLARFTPPAARPDDADYRVWTAVSYVRRTRPLSLALLAVAAAGFAADPAMTLAPLLAENHGGGTELVDALSAAFGVGAAFGLVVLALLRGRLPSAWVSSSGLWLLIVGSVTLAFDTAPSVALLGIGVGLGFGLAMTGLTTVVQERTPDEMRGRVLALWLAAAVGSRPLGAALLGTAADLWTAGAAFTVAAGTTLTIALVCRPSKLAAAD